MEYDILWYDMIRYDIWYDTIWYMIWYDMIHGMIWYDMISELLVTTYKFAIPQTCNKTKIKIRVSNNQSMTTKGRQKF
jgi:hypothetical protein